MFLEHSNETRADCLFLWSKMLLPNSEKRIYNQQSKQLIKLFSQVKYCTVLNIYYLKLNILDKRFSVLSKIDKNVLFC